ncbi:MAG: VOC family protein [Hyphomicrobiales bacterium]
MSRKIFVNLPVNNLEKSKAFFGKLGFTFNTQFTDETAACMVISEDIYAMLLTHDKWRQFTDREIAGPKVLEVMTCLSADNRDEVNRLVDAAVSAGGEEKRPAQDYGFMFMRSFEDLDGHVWEFAWMDPAHIQQS